MQRFCSLRSHAFTCRVSPPLVLSGAYTSVVAGRATEQEKTAITSSAVSSHDCPPKA